jgi:hypothetical protein
VAQGDGIDDVTGACLAAAHHKQARCIAAQRLLVHGQVVKPGFQEIEIGVLADGADDRVHLDGELGSLFDLGPGTPLPIPDHARRRLGELNGHDAAVSGQDALGRSPLKQVDALALDRGHFPMIGRQLPAGPVQGQVDLHAQAAGHRGRVQGRDPAADHGRPLPAAHRLAQVDPAQERGCRDHAFCLFSLQTQGVIAGGDTGRQADGVVTLLEQGRRILDRAVGLEDDAKAEDVVNILLQNTLGQPVGGDAHAHHPPGHR